MAETRATIEERLSQLVQENSETTCWQKLPVKIFAIISFIVLAGILGISLYFLIGWQIVNKDLQGYEDKITANINKFNELNKTDHDLLAEINLKYEKIRQLNSDINTTKHNITVKTQEIENVIKDIENTNKTINATQKNLDEENGKHNGLVEENKRLEKELDSIAHAVEEIKAKLLVVTKQLSVWKLLSGFGFLGSALTAFGGFAFGGELAAANRNIVHLALVEKAFSSLSRYRENYIFLSKQKKLNVARRECYRWKGQNSISSCFNHPDLITTILTNTGYRFGIITTAPWTDKPSIDEGAFAFSSHYGVIADMRPGKHINIMANDNVLNFGEKDLLLNLNTGQGSTDIISFNNPIANNTFFTPESNFAFDELFIEAIHIER